jgi:hypothetical protein
MTRTYVRTSVKAPNCSSVLGLARKEALVVRRLPQAAAQPQPQRIQRARRPVASALGLAGTITSTRDRLTEADTAARMTIGRGHGRTGVSCRTQRGTERVEAPRDRTCPRGRRHARAR